MTKNEKRIYKETGNQLKARDIITRRRWIIFLSICAVIVTLLHLWIVVFYFAGVIVFIGYVVNYWRINSPACNSRLNNLLFNQ